MVALKIEDLKAFTSKLFIGETFDTFLTKEVTIVTYNTFTIDGHIRQGYYSEEELEEKKIEEMSSWKVLKPFCFSLIKGSRLPESFQIVFMLSPERTEKFLKSNQLPFTPENINGLYLNIRYEEKVLNCVTGTSVNVFTLDKSLDRTWEEAVRLFLKKQEIPFEEM